MVGRIISHYKILERIGAGGMGIVYKAHDFKLDRFVALKFLPPDLTLDPKARQRFIHEARAASAFQHNNICAIHDIDQTDDGQIFLCMDCYEGETLKTRLERSRVSRTEALEIAGQLAAGLREAHRRGIVHRDVKPANVFVTTQGVVKILDFGLAKLAGQAGMTREGSTVGTPAYMSPEQTRGDETDQRTDVWSFGVVLYELLVGRPPFRGEHPLAVMYSINNEEPREPADIDRAIPRAWSSFCMRCLRKDPGERIADLEEASVLSGSSSGTRGIAGAARRFRFGLPASIRWSLLIPVFLIALLLIWYLAPTRTISLEKNDLVVVADVDNRTENPVFDHSLLEGIRVSLRQSDRINILPADQVSEAREFLKIPPEKPLDLRAALSVAKREGARAVIAADVSRLGSIHVLECGIVDATSGETVRIVREEAARIEDVLSALDNLCRKLRASLGESMAEISRAGQPLAEVTTPSLEALDLYSRSEERAAEGKYNDAAVLLEKAVTLDSGFVMAISDLAYCYRKTDRDSLASLRHRQILPLIGRATERERLEMLSVYYGPSFEMDYPKAYEQLQTLTVRYPADAYAYATLGHLAMFAGDTKAALEANAKAVALYPRYDRTCYNNSGFALALAGQPEEALAWFRRAKALRPDFVAIDVYTALAFTMKGAFDSAAAALQEGLASGDPSARNRCRVVLACGEYTRGRLDTARNLCLEGIRECRKFRKPQEEAYFHLLLGVFAAEAGLRKEYRAEMELALSLSRAPYFELPLAGVSYAREGMTAEAEDVIRRIAAVRNFDPYFLRRRSQMIDLVRGYLALARGETLRARQILDAVEKVEAGDPFYLLARKGAAECAARSSDPAAVQMYEALLAARGEVMMGSLKSIRQSGVWTRWLWPEADLDLARYYASARKSDRAGEYVAAALECWKGADPRDRRAAEARNLLSRITKDR